MEIEVEVKIESEHIGTDYVTETITEGDIRRLAEQRVSNSFTHDGKTKFTAQEMKITSHA